MSHSDRCIGRMWTAMDWTFGYVWRTSLISDSSMRSTLIFTWVSNRPRKCKLPSRSRPAIETIPADWPYRSGRNFHPVFGRFFRYPSLTPSPAMSNSPACCSFLTTFKVTGSTIYNGVFANAGQFSQSVKGVEIQVGNQSMSNGLCQLSRLKDQCLIEDEQSLDENRSSRLNNDDERIFSRCSWTSRRRSSI